MPTLRVLGIDLCATQRKASVSYDGSYFRLLESTGEVLDTIRRGGADVVAMDAPITFRGMRRDRLGQTLDDAAWVERPWEKALRKWAEAKGVRVRGFSGLSLTPRGLWHSAHLLCEDGFSIDPRDPRAPRRGRLIEVHPGLSLARWQGRLPSGYKAKRARCLVAVEKVVGKLLDARRLWPNPRRDLFTAIRQFWQGHKAVCEPHDVLDAWAAWATGKLLERPESDWQMVGTVEDGYVLLPMPQDPAAG